MSKKIKVLIVDDSAVVRQVLTMVLSQDNEIDVIASAADPLFAIEKMNANWPDVIVLDIEMPRMDGLTFLKQIMSIRPTPVVICSSQTAKGSSRSIQALGAGAVAVIGKPKSNIKQFLLSDISDILAEVKAAAKANMKPVAKAMVSSRLNSKKNEPELVKKNPTPVSGMTHTAGQGVIVAIGTSTGGTQALEYILTGLPAYTPGIVIVQHMPEVFTRAYAERLNKICAIEVLEAKSGDMVCDGRALIAAGGLHMRLQGRIDRYTVETYFDEPVNHHRPSVDVLFESVAKVAGRRAIGIILTGMGGDGARGLLKMREAGAETWAQDEKSCVVYGMPKEAVKLGAVDKTVALKDIPTLIAALSQAESAKTRPG